MKQPSNSPQLFPHIKHVMQKFTKQLSKDDLKKFAKEVGKKLVASDFKNNRVEDPTKISDKQEKKVKKYVRDFFEKAVEKRKAMDKKKKEKEALKLANGGSNGTTKSSFEDPKPEAEVEDPDEIMDLTPDSPIDMNPSPHPSMPATPSFSDLKRKREDTETSLTPGRGTEDPEPHKRLKEEDTTPPPPPPPPPADSPGMLVEAQVEKEETEEEKELRKQEEDLMRENEEALMMDMDGSLKSEEEKAGVAVNGLSIPVNGNGNGYTTTTVDRLRR